MQLKQAIPELVQSALIFLALLLAPQIGTQWAVLKWGVGRSSASPSSVLKGQTEATLQTPEDLAPLPEARIIHVSSLYLCIFLFFFFSVLDSSEDKG